MGNTSPWAATFCRASLLSLDKLQAASVKPQATSFKRQAATFRALPGISCCSILSSNKSNGAIASVSMRDLLIPLVDGPSHKSDSVRPARGSFSFPKIKATSRKRQALQGASCKLQASSSKPQASSRKRQAPGPCVLHKVSRS